MEIAAILIMGVMWAYREYSHNKTLGQVLASMDRVTDKLMARNFEEYKELTSEPRVYEPVTRTEAEEWEMEQKELSGVQ
jgi:hypothetical protein